MQQSFSTIMKMNLIVITRARFAKHAYRSLRKEGYARWAWQTAWLEMGVNVGFLM
jgi:hypothetical protein